MRDVRRPLMIKPGALFSVTGEARWANTFPKEETRDTT
jgi:hypothetical protein